MDLLYKYREKKDKKLIELFKDEKNGMIFAKITVFSMHDGTEEKDKKLTPLNPDVIIRKEAEIKNQLEELSALIRDIKTVM